MAIPKYQRRVTGEMAIDPALHTLVMASATMVDRLLCAGVGLSPIGGEPPAAELRPKFEPAPGMAGGAERTG